MEIKLEHNFWSRCHDKDDLLDGVFSFPEFERKLIKQSKLNPDFYPEINYKADGFEAFVEALIKLNSANKEIGIIDYHPAEEGAPGIDGFGKGLWDFLPGTVQIKWKGNKIEEITTGNTHNIMAFPSISYRDHGVPVDTETNLLLITTAAGLNYYTQGVMLKGVRCIGYKKLCQLTNTIGFWNLFRELVKEII